MRVSLKAIIVATALLTVVGGADAAIASQSRECQTRDLKVTVVTSKHQYSAGASVKMIATIRNISTTACTVAVGGTSPSMSITNTKGVVVWDNCYVNDEQGACALYLALRTLNPGNQLSTTGIWKQHIAGKVAPRGTYIFEASYAGITTKHRVKFALAK